jgi:hypothetical protein
MVMINLHLEKGEILKAAAYTSGLTNYNWSKEHRALTDTFFIDLSLRLRKYILHESEEENEEV